MRGFQAAFQRQLIERKLDSPSLARTMHHAYNQQSLDLCFHLGARNRTVPVQTFRLNGLICINKLQYPNKYLVIGIYSCKPAQLAMPSLRLIQSTVDALEKKCVGPYTGMKPPGSPSRPTPATPAIFHMVICHC